MLGFGLQARVELMRMPLSVGIVRVGRARARGRGLGLHAWLPTPPRVLRPLLRVDSFPKPGFARHRRNRFVLPSTGRLRGAVGDRLPSGRSSRVALPIDPALRADAFAPSIAAHSRRRRRLGLWSLAREGSQVGGLRSSVSSHWCHSVGSTQISGMPPSRPGCWQRRRTWLAVVVCGVVWGFRWVWPLQLVPGWVVVSLAIWAGLELIVLLRYPRRWR